MAKPGVLVLSCSPGHAFCKAEFSARPHPASWHKCSETSFCRKCRPSPFTGRGVFCGARGCLPRPSATPRSSASYLPVHGEPTDAWQGQLSDRFPCKPVTRKAVGRTPDTEGVRRCGLWTPEPRRALTGQRGRHFSLEEVADAY